MSIDEKMKVLKEKGYPVDEMSMTLINRNYERVIGMDIDTIKGVGDHSHQDNFEEGENEPDS